MSNPTCQSSANPTLPLGKRFWSLDARERDALETLFADPAVCDLILSLDRKDKERTVRLVDAAYWVKGCSSLGLLRYAVIVGLDGGKGRTDYALIDLKEAVAPIAPSYQETTMPSDEGERVATAARALSPHLGSRMNPIKMLGHSMFIRELAPQDLKLEVEQFSDGEAIKAARYLAFVIGKAHGRQLDASSRADWLNVLEADRRDMTDARPGSGKASPRSREATSLAILIIADAMLLQPRAKIGVVRYRCTRRR